MPDVTPTPTPLPAETFTIFDQVAGRVRGAVTRPAEGLAVVEWDAQPLIWKVRGQWTRGLIDGEQDYKIQLRSNVTQVGYKMIEHVLRAYPAAALIRMDAVARGKLPPELAAGSSRLILRMKITRATVERLGWKGLNDLFPPKEIIDSAEYVDYLRLFQD